MYTQTKPQNQILMLLPECLYYILLNRCTPKLNKTLQPDPDAAPLTFHEFQSVYRQGMYVLLYPLCTPELNETLQPMYT
jgi:hypothetical protein